MFKNKQILFLLATVVIIVLYFFLRIFHILSIPLFTDEAIYIRWAQIAKQDATWRFISLTDGKQPMYVWIAMILLKFVKEPLLAGRLVSVIAGVATTVGLFFLGSELFRDKGTGEYKVFGFTQKTVTLGLISSFLYVIYPFGLVYDRMALYDSLVASFAVWGLYLLVLMVRTLRLDVALIAGIVAGGGVLTKSNDFFTIYSLPLLLLIFDWKKKIVSSRLARFIGLSLVVVVLSYAMYSILRLSPFFHIIGDKNALFVYPIREWVTHPFAGIASNLRRLVEWFVEYFSPPWIILIIYAFVIKREKFTTKLLLVAWFLFPFSALAFFGKLIYPRFTLFMTMPLLPIVAYSIYELFIKYRTTLGKILIAIFVFGFPIYADFFIVTNFAFAPIPKPDTGQFINSWAAGNGVKQSVAFFREQAQNQKIYIMTEGTFGLMPFGLEMYLVNNPNVKIHAVWPIQDFPPKEVVVASKIEPVYLVFYQDCTACQKGSLPPFNWPVKLISEYRQGNSDAYYRIYQFQNK